MKKRFILSLLLLSLLLAVPPLCAFLSSGSSFAHTLSVSAAGLDSGAVSIGGNTYDLGEVSVTITDADAGELSRKLPQFSGLQTVYLQGTLPDAAALLALKDGFPEILFVWEFSVCGVSTDTQAEFLDLSGIRLDSTAELEAALPCFYQLKQVDMIDCGISNEEMEALNQRHPGTKFVWALEILGIRLRTDATSFMPTKHGYRVFDEHCQLLRYCHDLECIDLGHMPITNCSFLYGTPRVKYLILADTSVSDLTPVGFLTELEFLEIFLSKASDYSPLMNCTKLRDLNLCYCKAPDSTPLHQMVWLDRLWASGTMLSASEPEDIQQTFPYTTVVRQTYGSTEKGWRLGPRYYEMRDIFEMPYSTD